MNEVLKGAVSIGMLRYVASWPAVGMPEWANTVARRMLDQGVTPIRVKEVIAEMERVRRVTARRLLKTDVTEADIQFAKILNEHREL